MNPTQKAPVIHRNRPMTAAETEKAVSASKDMYPQDMPCMVCLHRWMQHKGLLCPSKPGYVSAITGMPVPPTYGGTTFVPDEMYFDKNPNFDVV